MFALRRCHRCDTGQWLAVVALEVGLIPNDEDLRLAFDIKFGLGNSLGIFRGNGS